uniref:Uncharacterized protein n=1 Tax=Oryza sativa subsp. indica TaxID=39946 RepID=A0A8F2VW27_ORYSI|nr:hypothetical protein Xa7_IRBB7.28 [Oryza sativa Indica Group]
MDYRASRIQPENNPGLLGTPPLSSLFIFSNAASNRDCSARWSMVPRVWSDALRAKQLGEHQRMLGAGEAEHRWR